MSTKTPSNEMPATTAELARAIAAAAAMRMPRDAAAAARNTLLNVAGVAIGASRHEGVDVILRAAARLGGKPVAIVPGRAERADPHYAALATGFAAHVDDFDDTHLQTKIHSSASCFGTLVGTFPGLRARGEDVLRAFALGCEVQLRIGRAMTPAHYDAGWHITGTVGVIGAATTAAVLLQLEEERMRNALAIAASMTLGHRVAFGTMTKPMYPGKAAANGILAAGLAARGFTGPPDAFEAERGYANLLAAEHDFTGVADDLGRTYMLLENTFKPYPCGLVAHPGIDAALAIRERVRDVSQIASARLGCHPLVLDVMGKPAPRDGLEARFSARHAVAVALIDGAAGLAQFAEARVHAADVTALRQRIELVRSERIAADEALLSVALRDGTTLEEHVPHARGSLDRPMTSADLVAKTRGLVESVIPGGTERLCDAVESLEREPDARRLVAALVPGAER